MKNAKQFIESEIKDLGYIPSEHAELISEGIEQAEILSKKDLSTWIQEMLEFKYDQTFLK